MTGSISQGSVLWKYPAVFPRFNLLIFYWALHPASSPYFWGQVKNLRQIILTPIKKFLSVSLVMKNLNSTGMQEPLLHLNSSTFPFWKCAFEFWKQKWWKIQVWFKLVFLPHSWWSWVQMREWMPTFSQELISKMLQEVDNFWTTCPWKN